LHLLSFFKRNFKVEKETVLDGFTQIIIYYFINYNKASIEQLTNGLCALMPKTAKQLTETK